MKDKVTMIVISFRDQSVLLPGGNRGGEFGADHMVFRENEGRISGHNQSQWTNEREP